MSFNKYYQDELSFLREMGQEFSMAYPSAAQFLADRGSDPDVERMLEGFAFLTGRIRQKLDDEFPEIIQAMMNLLWPHYLRPIPSMSMLEFEAVSGMLRDLQKIPRGTEVDSVPVEGTTCRFHTCFDVNIAPISLNETILETPSGSMQRLRLQFKSPNGINISHLKLDRLRLHLFGEPSYSLYLWLCHYVTKVKIGHEKYISLEPTIIKPVGFEEDEGLLPYPEASLLPYRLLQEYFAFPGKFLFVDIFLDIRGLKILNKTDVNEKFEIIFEFSRPLPPAIRVTRENIRLNCTPVVNLFSMDSDPIRVEHDKVDYRIRPSGSNSQHYEIYSADKVKGWLQGSAKEHQYESFYSFRHGLSTSKEKKIFYQTHLKSAVVGDGTETYISFVNSDSTSVIPPTEIVTVNLTCTNRFLAGTLRVGDINTPTGSSPGFVRFSNITRVLPAIPSYFGGDIYWRLISHLSLNQISISNVDALRGILSLYNFHSIHDRQAARANELRLEGIHDIRTKQDTLLSKGVPIRGISTIIELQEDKFAEEGDMYLFANVLNEFLSLYASINSYTHLTVKGIKKGEVYKWAPRIGQQIII